MVLLGIAVCLVKYNDIFFCKAIKCCVNFCKNRVELITYFASNTGIS